MAKVPAEAGTIPFGPGRVRLPHESNKAELSRALTALLRGSKEGNKSQARPVYHFCPLSHFHTPLNAPTQKPKQAEAKEAVIRPRNKYSRPGAPNPGSSTSNISAKSPFQLNSARPTVMPLADFRSKTVEDIRRMRPSRYEHTFASLAKVLPTNDDFFEMHFNQTFLNIYDYVERVFTTQLLGNQSPWLLPWSKESIEYAGEVATPGPNGLWDDWDYLMYSGTDRTYLLTGIIFKALDVHVFSSKLFGAAPKYLEFLDQQDRQYANLEGVFARGFNPVNAPHLGLTARKQAFDAPRFARTRTRRISRR